MATKNNNKDINKLEKPNLYYVKVKDGNDRFVVRQARFAKLLCRADSMRFGTNTNRLEFVDGNIDSIIQLAGVDTRENPITDLSFDGHYLKGFATFEAAAKEESNIYYFWTHSRERYGVGSFVNTECFAIRYEKVVSELKKYFEVEKQTYKDDETNEAYENFDIKVFGYKWNGTKAVKYDITDEVYFDVLNGKVVMLYTDAGVYYPTEKACEKSNEIVCYRFDD